MSQPGRAMKAVEEIEALTDAIARRDAKAAVKVCTTHIKNAAKAGMRGTPHDNHEHNGHQPLA
jgi:DNA-binding GntR family transcriptional regulator